MVVLFLLILLKTAKLGENIIICVTSISIFDCIVCLVMIKETIWFLCVPFVFCMIWFLYVLFKYKPVIGLYEAKAQLCFQMQETHFGPHFSTMDTLWEIVLNLCWEEIPQTQKILNVVACDTSDILHQLEVSPCCRWQSQGFATSWLSDAL